MAIDPSRAELLEIEVRFLLAKAAEVFGSHCDLIRSIGPDSVLPPLEGIPGVPPLPGAE